MHVVDRVEAAPGEEGQIAPVAREDGVLVLEAAVGDVDDDGGAGPLDAGELDLAQRAPDAWVRPGQPGAVRRERQIADRTVDGADQLGGFAGGRLLVGVQQEQPAVVRGDRQAFAVRVGDQLLDPADQAGGEPARCAVAAGPRQGGDLDRVLALRVGDVRDLATAAEHLRQPYAHTGGVRDGAGGAVAVGEPVEAAADGHGAGAAGLVDRERVDVAGGRYLVRTTSRARAAEADLQLPGHGVGRLQVVDQPHLARALVDDPPPVAGGVPGVERVVVRVAAQIGAVGPAGVEVADALVVGEEGDAAPDEHRGCEVPVDVREQPLAVQPQPSRRPAPVPLPGGGFVRRCAGEQQGAPLAFDVGDRDVGDRAPRQPPAGAAVGGHAVGPGEVRERLVVRGHGEDLRGVARVGGPAADPGVRRAPVGEPAGRAACHRCQMDLGVEAAPGRVGDPGPVGGEARMADSGAVDGQAPGASGHLALGGEGATQRSSSAAKQSRSSWRCGNRRYETSSLTPQCFPREGAAATCGAEHKRNDFVSLGRRGTVDVYETVSFDG